MFRRGLRRAALLCAWFSDLKLQCLFATFLSTSLDDFEALGANGLRSEECVGCGAAANCDYLLASFCFM